MLHNLIKGFTALAGLALCAFMFVFFVHEATKVRTWRNSGSLQSHLRLTEDSAQVFRQIDHVDFPQPPVPQVGDTLISINDSAATLAALQSLSDAPRRAGEIVPLTYRHGGDTYRTEAVLSLPETSDILLITVLQGLRFLIIFLFVAVGLWAFFVRPNSAGVRAMALFSFAMASFMISAVHVFSNAFATFEIPLHDLIRGVLDVFAGFFSAFWLNLLLLFPRPARFLRDHPRLSHLVCYFVPGALTVLYLGFQIFDIHPNLGVPFLLLFALQVIAGLVILASRYRHSVDRLERRQTRLVLWGSGGALTLFMLTICLLILFGSWFQADPPRALIAVNVAFLGLLLSPISFVWAFGRYRLLEVEAKVRRGTRYLIALVVAVAVVAIFGYASGSMLRETVASGGTWSVALVMAVGAIILPAARSARRLLERQFYPERRRLRQLIHDFLQRTAALADKQAFWAQLEERLCDGLAVDSVYPILRGNGDGDFHDRRGISTPFQVESHLIQRLARDRRPLMVDEIIAGTRFHLSHEESRWLEDRRVALILPLVARDELVGMLALGMKTQREDYAPEELRILDSLTQQIAVASENIRLVEENVEKRRLEEQLQMARRIQNGFLPHDLPPTPGIEVAARSHFCLEVAGDYHDVIALDNGETVLAVADVSGKGAGAALLMANLQASLRTAVGVGARLADIVARINDLIHRNTPPEEYITFFVGIFDPAGHALTYVNAGHNPPLLRRKDGTVDTLDCGGLILGTLPGMGYDQETIPLAAGDLLLMYSDGVSEAMNADSEEFGEARLIQFLHEHRALPPPDFLCRLEDDVTRFHGSALFEDDFTLVLARVE